MNKRIKKKIFKRGLKIKSKLSLEEQETLNQLQEQIKQMGEEHKKVYQSIGYIE